ncbi:hypothetical protein LCGC14_0273560 [marine sediment metagenome]|uniref:Uncharacterized protein n=2 Tax=root TaxID=1 RepID=A0A9C9TJW1_9HYPH|nr:hypothetical protein [Aurantimonas coralicida]
MARKRCGISQGLCAARVAAAAGGAPAGPVLTVDLQKITASPLELGAILPVGTQFNAFEMDAAGALVTRTIQDDDGNGAVDILGEANPVPNAGMGFSYEKTTIGGQVTFTYVADDGTTVAQDTEQYLWLPRIYLGVEPIPGAVDEAFIEALVESELRGDKGIARTGITWTTGEYIWIAFPQAFNPTDVLDFLIGVFPGGFLLDTVGVAVTANTAGSPVPILYDVWRSTGAGIGLLVDVSVTP